MSAAVLERVELKESFSVNPTALRESKDGSYIKELSDGRYRVRCKGQHCGIVNRNNRRYGADETWGKHTRTESAFMRRVKVRRVTGQLEHPPDGKSSMGLAAICITEVAAPDPETGVVMVTFETMSTEPGRIVEAYIRDGVGFGLSSRGNGSVRRAQDGVDEVQGDFEPISFDAVLDESTPGAEVMSRMLREALEGCRKSLMESAGGDLNRVADVVRTQNDEACRRDALMVSRSRLMEAQGTPPKGHNEYLLGLSDGSGHYRAYINGTQQWDVWMLVHNLAPEQVASSLPTMQDAKGAAESHAARIMRESYTVDSAVPFNGTMVVLKFDSDGEAKSALTALEKAGFNGHLKGSDGVCAYTSYEDPTQAEAHILRVLEDKKIKPRDESFGVIRHGRVVWEDVMADTNNTLLREIHAKLNEMSYDDDDLVGMDYDECADDMEFESDMDYDDDDMDYDDDDMEYESDEEDDDEEDDDDQEETYYEADEDPDVSIEGSPEDELSRDRMMAGNYESVDMPRKHNGEIIGVTRVWLDEDGNVAEIEQVDEVTSQQRAMFAKAFGTDARAQTARSGTKSKPTPKTNKGYRKFRRNYAKKHGLNQASATKNVRKKKKKSRKESMDEVTAPQRAMFAKAFGTDARAQTARSGTKSKPTPKTNKGYRKFRRNYAKKHGLNQASATKNVRKKKGKKGKSRKESVVTLAKLVEATATLLQSPHQQDVFAGLRMVMEAGADWPQDARSYVMEAIGTASTEIEDDNMIALMEAAAEHLFGGPLPQLDEGLPASYKTDSAKSRAASRAALSPAEKAAKRQRAADKLAKRKAARGESYDDYDDYDDVDDYVDDYVEIEGDDQIEAYEARIGDLESENAQLTELVNAMNDLSAVQAVESKVDVLCIQHPVLEKVRDKLLNCESSDDVVIDANNYLDMIGESASTAVKPQINETAGASKPFATTSVPAGSNGSLRGPLEENIKPLFGGKPKVQATSSRVAEFRRRQRGANRQG